MNGNSALGLDIMQFFLNCDRKFCIPQMLVALCCLAEIICCFDITIRFKIRRSLSLCLGFAYYCYSAEYVFPSDLTHCTRESPQRLRCSKHLAYARQRFDVDESLKNCIVNTKIYNLFQSF